MSIEQELNRIATALEYLVRCNSLTGLRTNTPTEEEQEPPPMTVVRKNFVIPDLPGESILDTPKAPEITTTEELTALAQSIAGKLKPTDIAAFTKFVRDYICTPFNVKHLKALQGESIKKAGAILLQYTGGTDE